MFTKYYRGMSSLSKHLAHWKLVVDDKIYLQLQKPTIKLLFVILRWLLIINMTFLVNIDWTTLSQSI